MTNFSRREFLSSVAGAALARDAKSPIVDTHMHVWSGDIERFPVAHPYDPNLKLPPIAGTAEMLVEEMDQFGIDYCVLVQVIYYGWDNRYVADCQRRYPRRFRTHGLIDPTDPGVAQKLRYWMREHKFSGMRFSPIYYRERDDWINSPPHHTLWKSAEELRAVFNYFIAADQLPKLEGMIAKFPGVRVVIDHFARVELAAADSEAQIRKLLALARYRNVHLKVSELSIISPSKKYPYSDTFPLVRRVYDAFGPDRLLWGTGYPGTTRLQGGRPSLQQELALVRSEIPFFTAEDREKILGRNAVRLWKFAR